MARVNWQVIEGRRYNLESAVDLGIQIQEWGLGMSLRGVYLRGGRVIVHTYSIWQKPGTSECVGDRFYFAEPDVVAMLANETRNKQLMALVPEGD